MIFNPSLGGLFNGLFCGVVGKTTTLSKTRYNYARNLTLGT